MKKSFTALIFCFALISLISSQSAIAVSLQQADELFDAAELTFPDLFSPSGLPTLSFLPDYPQYRGPYSNGTFMAIGPDDSVYVAGGSFGFPPTFVGSYSDLAVQILGQSGNDDNTICNTDDLPEGINYSQNGNEITVTTDGCIVIPMDQGLCDSPDTDSTDPQVTGISVLTETNILESALSGLTSNNPMFLDTFNNIADDTSACIINAAPEYAPSTINTDVCFDFTDLAAQLASIPDVTVTPPVTLMLQSTSINSVVDDCFATGAPIITDNVSGNIWNLQPDGNYLQIPAF